MWTGSGDIQEHLECLIPSSSGPQFFISDDCPLSSWLFVSWLFLAGWVVQHLCWRSLVGSISAYLGMMRQIIETGRSTLQWLRVPRDISACLSSHVCLIRSHRMTFISDIMGYILLYRRVVCIWDVSVSSSSVCSFGTNLSTPTP